MTNPQSTHEAIFNAAHLKVFHDFRVPDEVLSRFPVRSVNDKVARLELGLRGPRSMDMGGLAFLYTDPKTGRQVTVRVRRDNPEVDQEGKPKNKYVLAWGNRRHLFLPPDILEKLADPETAICLVESEKAAIAGTAWADRMRQKIVFIAMGGCYGWLGRIGIRTNSNGKRVDEKGPLPDLDYCNGRKVYLALDANASTNRMVKQAQARLVRELMLRDSKVSICTLPALDGVNGLDDLLVAESDEAMLEVFARAVASRQTKDFGDGHFELNEGGVWYMPNPDQEGNAKPSIWLCTRLEIVAKTRDHRNKSWGLLLKWLDQDDELHSVALPMEWLRRDGGTEALCLLENEGLTIGAAKNVKDYLLTYLRVWPCDYRARCVDKPGWVTTSSGSVYVLPDGAIGSTYEPIVFQTVQSVTPAFSSSGTIEEWKQNVATPSRGNSRLVFAISTAFTGPLLDLVGESSGGFSYRGPSSIGKTTALVMSASVWGDPEKYCRTWRSTLNGLEGMATLANDNLLLLDELAMVESKEAGAAAYLLANGVGKSRAARSGMARPVATWRLLFLSAGESSLAQHMHASGLKPTAGQELRMAEIDADAGANMGMLEELHGFETPLAMVEALRDSARRYHGAVGQQYLRLLVKDRAHSTELAEWLSTKLKETLADFASAGSGGQVERVARRFALVAVAGELATKYQLTRWEEGEATRAAAACLVSWMNVFGDRGNREESQLLEQVRSFFEANGSSRFENVDGDDKQKIIGRCGFYRGLETERSLSGEDVPKKGGLREYLVLPQAFRHELCAGFDFRFALRVLKEQQWLIPGTDKTAQSLRLPGMGKTRAYVMSAKLWEEG